MLRRSSKISLRILCVLCDSAVHRRAAKFMIAGCFMLFTVSSAVAQTTTKEIDAFTKQIDRYVKTQKNARIFATVLPETEDAEPKWQEFKNTKALEDAQTEDTAQVWFRQGKIVRADLMFTSQSGDWGHFITYYFRNDGSLIKLHAQLNTFYGDVSVVREQYFNARGKTIHSTKKLLDLQTQKPTKKRRDFYDNPVTFFRRTSNLPFHKLL